MITEGKTKRIAPLWQGADIGLVTTKDDITAGDGAKHDVILGKAELATRITCNVFEYLQKKQVPLAYVGRDGPKTFLTRMCTMIPVEVVVRRVAFGSFCKRYPTAIGGTIFQAPVVEFFYKTTGRKINDLELPCDDPWMLPIIDDAGYELYYPDRPRSEGFIGLLEHYIGDDFHIQVTDLLKQCQVIATDVNAHLRDAWKAHNATLYDFKLEFGVLHDGSVVVADVIDCDSWRVKWEGLQLSKQGYRDGDDLERVLGVYRIAAALTDRWV